MVDLEIVKRHDENDDNNDEDKPTLGMCLVLGVIAFITLACMIIIYLVK